MLNRTSSFVLGASMCALSFFSLAEAQGDLDKSLTEDWGLSNQEFLTLCEASVEGKLKLAPSENPCLAYFHALRDGYLRGAADGMYRAALYFHLDGELPPDGDQRMKYLSAGSPGLQTKAYQTMDSHSPECLRSVPALSLLEEFYEYLKQNGKGRARLTVAFGEFTQRKYAGKCKDGEIIDGARSVMSSEPTLLGKQTAQWHGTYTLQLPSNLPGKVDNKLLLGDKGFHILLDGQLVATGEAKLWGNRLILNPRWGQYLQDGKEFYVPKIGELQSFEDGKVVMTFKKSGPLREGK